MWEVGQGVAVLMTGVSVLRGWAVGVRGGCLAVAGGTVGADIRGNIVHDEFEDVGVG